MPRSSRTTNKCAELRLRAWGCSTARSPSSAGRGARALIAEAYGGKMIGGIGSLVVGVLRLLPFWPKRKRLTDTYLSIRT